MGSGGGSTFTINVDRRVAQTLCIMFLLHVGLELFDFTLGKPDKSAFHDFLTRPRPQKQIIFNSGPTKLLRTSSRKPRLIFWKNIPENLEISHELKTLEKKRADNSLRSSNMFNWGLSITLEKRIPRVHIYLWMVIITEV